MSWGFRDGWGAFWGHDDDGVNIVIIMIFWWWLQLTSNEVAPACTQFLFHSGFPAMIHLGALSGILWNTMDVKLFISNNGIYDNLSPTMGYMTSMKIYLKQWDIWQFISNNGIYDNLPGQRGLQAWSPIPPWWEWRSQRSPAFDHDWGGLLKSSGGFDNNYDVTLVLRHLGKRNLFIDYE